MTKQFTFIDLFAGIGGFRSALEMNGGQCLAFAEIDKHARQSYKAIYNTEEEVEWHDVTKITDDDFRQFRGRCDVITGGFPCQSFSIAGKRQGFNETRGTLFFEIARAIKEIQPSFALLENVKGLFSHDKGRTFGTIIQALDELGYVTEWGLFNSKFWGVPQNRERVFILVTRKDVFKGPRLFELLKQQTHVKSRLEDILEDAVDEKYYIDENKTNVLISQLKDSYVKEDNGKQIADYRYDEGLRIRKNKITPCLRANNKNMGTDSTDLSSALLLVENNDIRPRIAIDEYKEMVTVRKYDVDVDRLSRLLKDKKKEKKLSYSVIASSLEIPKTKAEHYFRTDKYFAIPEPDIWHRLKSLLDIEDNSFDESIMTFIEKENVFDTTNRIYDPKYIAPTLSTGHGPKIIDDMYPKRDIRTYDDIAPTLRSGRNGLKVTEHKQARAVVTPERINKRQNGRRFKEDGEPSFTVTTQDIHGIYDGIRIRKLTALECWRLQGFTDEQYRKAENDGVSQTQLYKQAGNSVTVNVIDAIIKSVLR